MERVTLVTPAISADIELSGIAEEQRSIAIVRSQDKLTRLYRDAVRSLDVAVTLPSWRVENSVILDTMDDLLGTEEGYPALITTLTALAEPPSLKVPSYFAALAFSEVHIETLAWRCEESGGYGRNVLVDIASGSSSEASRNFFVENFGKVAREQPEDPNLSYALHEFLNHPDPPLERVYDEIIPLLRDDLPAVAGVGDRLAGVFVDSERWERMESTTSPDRWEMVIQRAGLDPEDVMGAWDLTAGDVHHPEQSRVSMDTFMANLSRQAHALMQLEATSPGAAKYLTENFGIYGYARYPLDVLSALYDQRDWIGPYVILDHALADHKGQGMDPVSKRVIHDFYDDLQSHGATLRIVETENGLDTIKKLYRLRKKYGPTLLTWVSLHSNKNVIVYGNGTTGDVTTEDISRLNTKSVKSMYAGFPTVVIEGCHTGADDEGFAAGVSKLGARVYASNTKTELSSLRFFGVNGIHPKLEVVFAQPEHLVIFESGKRIEGVSES